MNKAQALDDIKYYEKYLPTSERAPSVLLDAFKSGEYGGTGEQVGEEIAQAVKAAVPRLLLAGGLTPDNVAARVAAVQPWGVDVASGVEKDGQPGKKDAGKVKAFIAAAKK
jgi:phosphoribosylanthranilate isomerase